MDDLRKFVDFLFKDQTGYVYAPVKKSLEWNSKFFSWPAERSSLLSHIAVNYEDYDVYLSPAVFSKKKANKESFKSTRVAWVEFDGKESIDFGNVQKPTAIVQTSSDTHVHCYWDIGVTTDSELLEALNRKLTFHWQADSSGVDCVQVLRPPTTRNHKYGKPVDVVLADFDESRLSSLETFNSIKEVPHKTVEINEATLIDPEKLLKELPLLKSLKHQIEKEQVETGQRSQFMYRIAHELAEIGCNHSQIASLIFYVDERLGKFKYRSDRLARVSELASIAMLSVESDELISLYTPNDIINHTDDLVWIMEKFLHSRGLMIITGAPGVGKTQLCLQLSYCFATGSTFMDWKLLKSKIMFFSLEMDVRELKEVIKLQKIDYDQWEEFSKNALFIDEVGTYLQYEEFIQENSPGVLIIDSLLELMEGDLNNNNDTKALTRWLKKIRHKYNLAIILIHHNRKANSANKKPDKLEDLFGSVVLNKDIETAFVMWQDEGSDFIDFSSVKARFSRKDKFQIERTNHLTFQKFTSQTEDAVEQLRADSGVTLSLAFDKNKSGD